MTRITAHQKRVLSYLYEWRSTSDIAKHTETTRQSVRSMMLHLMKIGCVKVRDAKCQDWNMTVKEYTYCVPKVKPTPNKYRHAWEALTLPVCVKREPYAAASRYEPMESRS